MNFTENALKQFKKLIDESENPNSGVHFYTTQGCCSPTLQMDIAKHPGQGENAVEIADVNIFVTSEANKILSGITIDYTEEGFRSVKTTNETPEKKCC